jgi:hypothetical protein
MNHHNDITRRRFMAAGSAALASVALPLPLPAAPAAESAFRHRGYYITFMRMPTYGLAAWKEAVDCFASDRINLLILWMAGGFRSKNYPITWKYNEEHENIRSNFAGELIDYAHSKGIKVLLGFTPFGYDGVNQYTIEHPELRALKKNGEPADKFGIHCWGWNLCPSKTQSQKFMLEYASEMYLDFYPQADGLLVESSDYAICHCPDCDGRFYQREFDFVRSFSERIWNQKPNATIVVYPHYFSGSKVPGFDAHAAKQPFDPRWTLFFTPHSAHVDKPLIAQAEDSLWSDDAPALHGPDAIRARAIGAREAKLTGYIPSLEGFSYIATHVEEGRRDLVGKRQVPFGFDWLKPDQMPFDQLPIRVNRIAYREFSQRPDLSVADFKTRLGRDIFGPSFQPAWIDDLLQLHRIFFTGRTWTQPAPLASPDRVRIDIAAGRIKADTLAGYSASLQTLQQIAHRHQNTDHPSRRDLHRIATWIVGQWTGPNAQLLEPTSRQ